MHNANLFDERFTHNEVAKQLKVHVATVYRWTFQGVRGKRLRSFLIGGRRYISRADLDAFLLPSDFTDPPVAAERSLHAQERLRSFGVSAHKSKGRAG
jgi:excisionase family DNA binding protein